MHPQKSTDSKKGPFFGPFDRKTGDPRKKNNILFCFFGF
jgi:hypothetical protein